MPGEAEAVFIYLAKFSITNKRFKNADTLYFLGRHGKLACRHLRWYLVPYASKLMVDEIIVEPTLFEYVEPNNLAIY